VFYAAGNVKAFAEPLVQNGVVLVSAWAANAIPTSEMVLAQILLSLRGYFRAVRGYRATKSFAGKEFDRRGINGETVGLLGLGKIATRVRSQLAAYPVKVIVYDPFLTPERATALDVEKVTMDEVFRRALVVSNHIPDIPDTRGVLTAGQFELMRDGATFINSGRGAQVIEADLLAFLEARPDVTALTDVTWPEPPAPDSAFWTLPNIVMSPHIGGTVGDEVVRLADLVIEEYERWARGEALQHQVTAEVLATMG
jgi:phosphoglycerate dehydrogenase-like enzyme